MKSIDIPFDVTDEISANRALAAIEEINTKLEEVKEKEKAILEDTKTWYAKEIQNIEEEKEHVQHLIEAYYKTELEKNKEFELRTPNGTVFNKTIHKWNYGDEKELLEKLETMGHKDLIRTNKALDKNKIKDSLQVVNGSVVDSNGEVIEGLSVEEVTSTVIRKN